MLIPSLLFNPPFPGTHEGPGTWLGPCSQNILYTETNARCLQCDYSLGLPWCAHKRALGKFPCSPVLSCRGGNVQDTRSTWANRIRSAVFWHPDVDMLQGRDRMEHSGGTSGHKHSTCCTSNMHMDQWGCYYPSCQEGNLCCLLI